MLPGPSDVCTADALIPAGPMASSCLRRGPQALQAWARGGVCQGPRCDFASLMARGSPEHVISGLGCHSWSTEVNSQGQGSCPSAPAPPRLQAAPEDLGDKRKQSSGQSTREVGNVQQLALFPPCLGWLRGHAGLSRNAAAAG